MITSMFMHLWQISMHKSMHVILKNAKKIHDYDIRKNERKFEDVKRYKFT